MLVCIHLSVCMAVLYVYCLFRNILTFSIFILIALSACIVDLTVCMTISCVIHCMLEIFEYILVFSTCILLGVGVA